MLRVFLFCLVLLTSIEASANTQLVASRGYGSTKPAALKAAKENAVEMATGVWLTSKKSLVGSKYAENTTSFSTGIVESFRVVKTTSEYVDIEAVVVERTEVSISSKTAELTSADRDHITQLQDRNEDLEKSIASIDGVNTALEFTIQSLEVDVSGANVQIQGTLHYRRDWQIMYTEIKKKSQAVLCKSFFCSFSRIWHNAAEKPPLLKNLNTCSVVRGKLLITDEHDEVLVNRDVEFLESTFLKRGEPNLDFGAAYTLLQQAVPDIHTVEVIPYCAE